MIVDLLASPAVAGFSVSKIRGQGPHPLHSMIGNNSPIEYEQNYYAHPDGEAPISGEPSLDQ
jgi:hypothetical protein